MIYKLIALIIVVSVIVGPLFGIAYLAVTNHLAWIALVPLHLWFLNRFFNFVKRISESFDESQLSSGTDKIGAKEKIVTVLDNGKKKKTF